MKKLGIREWSSKRGLEGWKNRGIAKKKDRWLEEWKNSYKKPAFYTSIPLSFSNNSARSALKELVSSYSLLVTRKQAKLAFTMAEILLSLTIIGVVAAITLPSLTGNINERTWNTQRKALYARFSQAISLMPSLNGYGSLSGSYSEDGTQTVTIDTAAETFVTNGLSKVLKINNVCSDTNYQDCGFPAKIVTGTNKIDTPTTPGDLYYRNILNLSYSQNMLNTKIAAFETANGESVLAYYNPNCKPLAVAKPSTDHPISWYVCANFVYDLNGKKGPNTFGKDIGIITAFYPSDSVVVAPQPFLRNALTEYVSWNDTSGVCRTRVGEEYRLPNLEEMAAIIYNGNVTNLAHERYWSSSYDSKGWPYILSASGNFWPTRPETVYDTNVLCVER